MEKQIWLIRHPEVENSNSRYFYGYYDVGLSPRGILQAEQLAVFLKRQKLQRIISTGLKRTDHVARVTSQANNIPWEVEPSLKEMHFGRWEGLSAKEVEKFEPELYKACQEADMDFCFPDGESIRDFIHRIKWGLEKVIREADERMAIITHSGVVRMALMNILNLDFQDNWRFHIDYGGITIFEVYDDYIRIRKINDTCHLHKICPD